LSSRISGPAALNLLFFLLCFVFLWLVVDLRLIYHGGGIVLGFPIFYRGWEFFRESVSWPGGFVEYISAFFAQFFYIGWAGALAATVQAWLLWQCSGSIMKAISGWQVRWVCFIPVIGLLVIYSRYSYQFNAITALLVTLGFVCLYLRIPLKSKPSALLVFLVLSIILYAIASWICLLFAALCAIYELLVRRRRLMGVTYLAAAPVISYIESLLIFDMGLVDALRNLRPFLLYEAGPVIAPVLCILYLFLPVTVTGLWLIRWGMSFDSAKKREEAEGHSPGRFAVWRTGTVARVIGSALPFVIGVVAVSLSHNDRLKTILEVDYYACRRMWPEVLQAARHNPRFKFTSRAVNRALYHTGRLAEDMFAYPQHPEELFSTATARGAAFWELFDTYLDLGQVNGAEYMLLVSMGVYGERPIFLKRLALVNMAKGKTGAAMVYLGALSRTLFDAGWARGYLEEIERDPNLSTDKEIQQLRSMMPETDRNMELIDENLLLDLLDKNRYNQMTFEYLMGFYLLTNQVDKFVGMLDRLNDFDYVGIPRVYEEAILSYSYMTKTKVELHGREISRQSHERFENFVKVFIGRYGTNKRAAFNELARDYGDSYLFYSVYRFSGIKR